MTIVVRAIAEAAAVDTLATPALAADVEQQPAAPPTRSDDSRARDWTRFAPLLLVAFAVGFGAWLLRAELRVLPFPNDVTLHAPMFRFAEQRMRSGHSPFDAWFPYVGLGSPLFVQYQSLPSILAGALGAVFGTWIFQWVGYLLIVTWPVSVYIGARLLGLDRWQAGAAALFSPMLANNTGYGFEWGSFVWMGHGLWSMLWALWTLPIALGLAWRAITRHERVALATFAVGLTCAFHFIAGYLVLLALAVFVLLHPPAIVRRLLRSAIVGVGGLVMFAFVFVPNLAELKYANVDSFSMGTFWVNSYGPGDVFGWLVRGEVFDHDRLPVVTLVVALGTIVCLARARRSEAARVPLGLLVLSLLLYSGRSVVGPVMNYLPGGQNILLHRYIIGVHFAGMLLAGIGAVWAWRFAVSAARSVPRLGRRNAFAIAIACTLAAAAMYPVLADRKHYADADRAFISGQIAADNPALRDITALIDIAKRRGDGRIYAGGVNSWGPFARVGLLPLYLLPVQQGADSIGLYERTQGLSTNIEPFFNDQEPAQYDLFNVKYVLVKSTQKPSIGAVALLARRGGYSLYEVATSGYLEVVDTTQPLAADRGDMAKVMAPYLRSRAVAQLRHPLVSFGGQATPVPSANSSDAYTGPPGAVEQSDANLHDGRFTGEVTASRPAWVMLKESYAPHWTATVDGKAVQPQMLAPSFVGVPVPAGTHRVVFAYEPSSSYSYLFALGALTLLGLVLAPWGWRRYGRRHPRTMNAPVT